MRVREANRGWLLLVLRSWREVREEGAEVRRRMVLVPARMTAAQRALKLERVGGDGEGGVYAERIRSGSRRGQTMVSTHELWWRRLREKVRAMGTWARVVAMSERAKKRWRRACAHAREEVRKRRRTRGKGGGTGHSGERRAKQVVAKWSTRVGMRLYVRWWIENAKGGDASGPMCGGGGGARATTHVHRRRRRRR